MRLTKSIPRSLIKPHNPIHNLQRLLLSTTTNSHQTNPPLSLIFEGAVGLRSKTEPTTQPKPESNELNTKLRELEIEIKKLGETQVSEALKDSNFVKGKKLQGRPSRLSSLFRDKNDRVKRKQEEEGMVEYKKLTGDAKKLVSFLYREGYFNEANFVWKGDLDFGRFCDSYGRDFIKYAVEKFGKDHQDIAKWLSGSDLKKVALFGCPSLDKKSVFSAKRMRAYFHIQENTVCNKCSLKHSCRLANQNVWNSSKNLDLTDVMRIITLYSLDLVPRPVSVPDEVKASVSKLLEEVLRLSQT